MNRQSTPAGTLNSSSPRHISNPEMTRRIAELDWSKTPLGAASTWPKSLTDAVNLCLTARLPMFVWWGPDLINIHNDAYIGVLGKRHSDALGQPAKQIWSDIWSAIAADVDLVISQGQPVVKERVRFVMERNGYPEETFFTYSHSPILDDDGKIGGLFQVCIDETARVLVERDRNRLADQRQLALDAASMGWWHYDPQTKIARYDQRYCEIFGVTGSQKPNEEILKRLHPDDLPSVWKRVEHALDPENPEPFSAKYRIVLEDQSMRWIQAHGVATFEGEGPQRRAVSFVGTVADLTDLNKSTTDLGEMVEKFERQSRLFERIASSTPDFIYVFDLAGRFLYANRRLLEVWGTTLEQAVGKNLYELNYPKWHADMHMRELRQVIDTRQPIRGEVPFTGGSGISGIYEYIFTPVLDPDGNVETIAGTTRDVTERKQNEQRTVRDATLLANVQDSVIVTDMNGIVTFWNQGASRLFGWTEQEMLGRHYADRFPETVRQLVSDWIKRIADGTASATERAGEWFDIHKDGSPVWIEGTTRHITGDASQPLGIIGVCRDITARKDAETEREKLLASERAARSEAERASRMKDEFLATLSHELRTPLNAILGWSTILASGTPSAEDLHDGLDTIQRNARAQTQIIEDLLDMSRIISGKVRLEVQRADLSQILQASIDTVRPAADAKSLRLRSVLDPHAGPVSGDPGRLQQVFWNLLTNAVKFTPKFGQIQVLLERVNSHVEVAVIDSGEGMRAEFLPHVFDRFRQADASTTRRHGGLGLGLAIVKQLVELHGGTVRVKSPGLGKGSTFIVALPLTVIHPELESDAPHRRHPNGAIKSADQEDCLKLTGLKVLVVDDEPDARTLVKRLLSDCDAVVHVAASVSEAMQVIAAERPDVLVSDIGMPGEDGYSLIRQLRALGPSAGGNIPAVALTAYARTDDRIRALRAGFQSHVVKPVDPTELITVIASLAGRTK